MNPYGIPKHKKSFEEVLTETPDEKALWHSAGINSSPVKENKKKQFRKKRGVASNV